VMNESQGSWEASQAIFRFALAVEFCLHGELTEADIKEIT